jgi:predicted NBD/HSP70 family sugar kinase
MAQGAGHKLHLEGLELQVVVDLLLDGPISRADLARRHGLTASTVTRLVAPLLKAGLIREADEEPRTGKLGRPSKPLSFVTETRRFVGIKLTADAVAGVLVDFSANVSASAQLPLLGRDPEAVVDRVAELTAELAGGESIAGIGVGLGGNVTEDDTVQHAPFLGWRGVPLGDLVTARTGVPTAIANDVAGLTEAERWFGAGHGLDSFALVTIGAGVGYGLVSNGARVHSPDYGVGLLGHIQLDSNGPRCPQGHIGCAAAMLSDWAIAANVSAGLGRPVEFDEALNLALDGNPVASGVVSSSGRALGRLIASIANIAMPQRVIISGEAVRLADVALHDLAAGIDAHREPLANDVDYVIEHSSTSDWARGAAVIAIQRYLLG